MNNIMLPAANHIVTVRNKLICKLIELNLSYAQIQHLDLCSVMIGAVLSIRIESGCDFITLTGEAKRSLNAWQILRPRSNPRSSALFITLRGKRTGQRISLSAIRHIGRQSSSKALIIRFGEHSENSNRKKDETNGTRNTPALRVIHGGRS